MQAEDFDAFATTLRNVHSFYGRELSDFALDVWWTALKSYDLAAIREAFGRHSVNPDTGQYAPKPADVVRMMEGSTQDSSIVAWSKVDRAVQTVGTYSTVAFDDALIHRVLADMGGWPQLGRKTVDEWPFVAKEFQTRYRGYKGRKETPAYPPKLIGLFDQENAQRGHAQSKPVLIGDPQRAANVLWQGSKEPLLQVTTMGESAQVLLDRPDEQGAA